MPRVRVLFFAAAREAAGGAPEEELALPAGATTDALLSDLVARHPGLDSVLRICVLAVNQDYVSRGAARPLADGDEVAVIPPLSGG